MTSSRNRVEELAVARPLLPRVEKLLPYLATLDSSRQYANRGALVQQFEQRLSKALGSETQIVVCGASGTSSLVGAVLAAAGRADARKPIALLPSYTFVGTLSAIQLCGYTPCLMDVDLDSWMLDPARCEAFDRLDRVGVVVPVGAYGRAVPQGPWQEFRRRTGIPVAIDAAASIEALIDSPSEFVGCLPTAISLHATKALCSGEGGAVICLDSEILTRTFRSLNFGLDLERHSSLPGLNGKMSEYHAAVGLAELDGWPQKQAAFEDVAKTYLEIGAEHALKGMIHVRPSVGSCYAIFDCRSAEGAAEIQAKLEQNRIGYRYWYGGGLHESTSGQTLEYETLSNTKSLSRRLIGLPMATDLTDDEVRRTLEAIMSVIQEPQEA